MLLLPLSQEQLFSHLKIISGLLILEARSGISIKKLRQHESAAMPNVLKYRSVEKMDYFIKIASYHFPASFFKLLLFAVDELIRNVHNKGLQV